MEFLKTVLLLSTIVIPFALIIGAMWLADKIKNKKPVMSENKNSELLESFTAYCHARPELRFWQALSDWTGNFVLLSDVSPYDPNFSRLSVADTFYWDTKHTQLSCSRKYPKNNEHRRNE